MSEPDLFGLAFGLSGAVNRANKFLDEFRTVIAAYWETPDTHKQFGIFRFQCWMFVSWLETLKASWQSSCTSNIGRSDALAPAVSVLGGVLADIIRRAVDTMADAVKFKQTYGSFEMADLQNRDTSPPLFLFPHWKSGKALTSDPRSRRPGGRGSTRRPDSKLQSVHRPATESHRAGARVEPAKPGLGGYARHVGRPRNAAQAG